MSIPRILLALSICNALSAADPPTVIRVMRCASLDHGRAYSEIHSPVAVLGAASASGLSESWFFELHGSFESVEAFDHSVFPTHTGVPYSDDVLPPSRTLIALYRPGLSHRAEEAVRATQKARYLMITIYRIRPGKEAGFADLVRIRRFHYENINFDQPELAYQVIAGAPAGTYALVMPLASLKTFDEGLNRAPDGPRAAGPNEQNLAGDVEIAHENFLFRLDPHNSYVSDDFAAGDPEFWRPKN